MSIYIRPSGSEIELADTVEMKKLAESQKWEIKRKKKKAADGGNGLQRNTGRS